jgi:hypothetical protein
MATGQSDWVQIGLKYGIGAVIALFLVYQMAGAQAQDIKQLLSDHQTLKFYLRGICLNTASTEAQARNCFPEAGK